MDALKFYQDSRWEGQGYDQDFSRFEVRDEGNQILTNPQFTYHNFAATAGFLYYIQDEVNKSWDVSANLSLATRSPNPSELFSDGVHQALASIELGDLRLEQERATKVSVGTHYEDGSTDFSATLYANSINNFIQLIPGGVETTVRGPFPVYDFVAADAFLTGIDLDYTQIIADREKWSASTTLNAAYIYGQNLDLDEPLIFMPAPRTGLSVGVAEKSAHGFYLRLRGDFVARQDRFPNYDYTVSILNEDGTRSDQLVRISEPPAGYAVFAGSLGGKFRFRESELNIRLNVTNIFDTAYRDYLNRQRFFAEELGRNFSISLTLNFI
jgi:iron complex outermembrane receptor protein